MAFKQAAGKAKSNSKTASSGVRVSLRPDNYGGGMGFDDFDGTIVSAQWEKYDRDGQDDEVIAIALTIHNDEAEDGEFNPFVRYYKAGERSPHMFDIISDGYHLSPNAAYAEENGLGIEELRLPKRCGAASLLISAIDAGADEDAIETEGLQVLENTRWHFKNVEKKFKNRETRKEETYAQLLIESELKQAATPPKPQAQAARAAAGQQRQAQAQTQRPAVRRTPVQAQAPAPVQAEVDGEFTDLATEYLLAKLAENNGAMTAGRLAKGVLAYGRANQWPAPTSNKVLVLVGDEGFLSQEGLGWAFDGETVTSE